MENLAKLGIDVWSILLYMINTGVIMIALFYLLYKPLLKFFDERRKLIADSIHEAKNLREEFAHKLKQSQEEKKRSEAELRKELEAMHRHIETKRKELMAEMEEERTKIMQKAHAEIEKKKTSIIKDAEKEVMQMMTRIILNIVQNKVPEKVIEDSIAEAWKIEKA